MVAAQCAVGDYLCDRFTEHATALGPVASIRQGEPGQASALGQVNAPHRMISIDSGELRPVDAPHDQGFVHHHPVRRAVVNSHARAGGVDSIGHQHQRSWHRSRIHGVLNIDGRRGPRRVGRHRVAVRRCDIMDGLRYDVDGHGRGNPARLAFIVSPQDHRIVP